MHDHDAPQRKDAEYEETVAPTNPPRSMVKPQSRTRWWASSFGLVTAIFLVVIVAFAVVAVRNATDDGRVSPEPDAAGTSGERMPRLDSPGGFDPAPRPGDTRDELEFRGAGQEPQGPMPGLSAGTISSIRELKRGAGDAFIGRSVRFEGVEVDRADGGTFWIRQDGESVAVIAPGGTPTVRAGQRVNITGTVERAGADARIHASRIDVR